MILLASASQARLRMLKEAGLDVAALPSKADEAALKQAFSHLPPEALALELATAKALDISAGHPGVLVVGADQVLDCEGRLFDKPESLKAAREQLLALKGRTHRLISAVVLARDGEALWRHAEEARLRMRDFSQGFLVAYLEKEGGTALASVGAYRIEGLGAQLFESIEGDHFTIQGLPLLALLEELRHQGEVAA
ncbi:MAG: septum formation protein Maf [Rhodospirillales bacterium]|nr:MAG: septum formation protein Maf [Rhodospirillales bacterium]